MSRPARESRGCMNFDDWYATEPDMGGRPAPDQEPVHECSDCRDEASHFSTTVPVDGGRRYCATCRKWREVRGLLFDRRHRDVLERECA